MVFYISFLVAMRRMWTGKYVRSPLARALFVNMVSENESASDYQEVSCSPTCFTICPMTPFEGEPSEMLR